MSGMIKCEAAIWQNHDDWTSLLTNYCQYHIYPVFQFDLYHAHATRSQFGEDECLLTLPTLRKQLMLIAIEKYHRCVFLLFLTPSLEELIPRTTVPDCP